MNEKINLNLKIKIEKKSNFFNQQQEKDSYRILCQN